MTAKVSINPAPGLYAVDIKRHPDDLGVSIIIPATCELTARARVLTLFPEYHRQALSFSLRSIEYVEIDWEASRYLVTHARKTGLQLCAIRALWPNTHKTINSDYDSLRRRWGRTGSSFS